MRMHYEEESKRCEEQCAANVGVYARRRQPDNELPYVLHCRRRAYILSCLLVLSGCGAGYQKEIQAPNNISRAKTIVFGMAWEPVGFYPLRAIDSASYYAQTLVYEGLLKYDSTLNIVPALAQTYSLSANKLVYTFQLRPNLRFSDGSPLGLKDVKASFQLALSPSSPFASDYKDIKSFAETSTKCFVVKLSQPNAAMLSRLVELKILPAKFVSLPDGGRISLSRAPVASGPFCLEKWQSGEELVFVPNPFYWGKLPSYSLIWRVIPNRALLGICLNRGEIDVAAIDPTTWVYLLKDNPRMSLDQFKGSRTLYLGLNEKHFPWHIWELRKAMLAGINRKQLIKKLYHNFADLAVTDVPSGSWAFAQDLAKEKEYDSTYDPVVAAQTIRKLKDQLKLSEVSFRLLTVADYQDLAQAISADLRKIGIKNEVEIIEFSTLRTLYLKPGKFDVVLWSRSSGPDPECGLVWQSHAPLNYSNFANAQLDELIGAARTAPSQLIRKQKYKEIQAILASQLPWLFLMQPRLLVAHANNIKKIGQSNQQVRGLPWDNPLFNAATWQKDN